MNTTVLENCKVLTYTCGYTLLSPVHAWLLLACVYSHELAYVPITVCVYTCNVLWTKIEHCNMQVYIDLYPRVCESMFHFALHFHTCVITRTESKHEWGDHGSKEK